jgi:hypothetical protein
MKDTPSRNVVVGSRTSNSANNNRSMSVIVSMKSMMSDNGAGSTVHRYNDDNTNDMTPSTVVSNIDVQSDINAVLRG